jgi:hypothetical protein
MTISASAGSFLSVMKSFPEDTHTSVRCADAQAFADGRSMAVPWIAGSSPAMTVLVWLEHGGVSDFIRWFDRCSLHGRAAPSGARIFEEMPRPGCAGPPRIGAWSRHASERSRRSSVHGTAMPVNGPAVHRRMEPPCQYAEPPHIGVRAADGRPAGKSAGGTLGWRGSAVQRGWGSDNEGGAAISGSGLRRHWRS